MTTIRGERLIRAATAALAGLVLLAGAGCGNVTSGGAGEVEVLLSSDEVDDGAAAAGGARAEDPLVGTMRAMVRSFVWSGEGELGDGRGEAGWIEITDGAQEVEVALSDPAPVTVARASLPAGEYRAVRTLFGRVRIHVEGGLTVEGEPVTGEIDVSFAPDGLWVVEERGVTVETGRALPVFLEMRVPAWIHRVDPQTRSIDGAELEREFRVRVRPPG